VWLHGEAVGCGMALAARLSQSLGMLDRASCERAIDLIQRAGLTSRMPDIAPAEMLDHMGRDKKNEAGAIRLILLKRIGEACVDGSVSAVRIGEFLGSIAHPNAG
jgi:3-dehydroquinate synthase